MTSGGGGGCVRDAGGYRRGHGGDALLELELKAIVPDPEALRLRLLEDQEREACAEKMGVTLGNFDVILHRACAAFRKIWQPEEE